MARIRNLLRAFMFYCTNVKFLSILGNGRPFKLIINKRSRIVVFVIKP